MAVSPAAGRGWADAFAAGSGPTARIPGHPLLLAGVYRCGSYQTSTGDWPRKVWRHFRGSRPVAPPSVGSAAGVLGGRRLDRRFRVALLPAELWTEVAGSHEQVLATPALLGLIAALDFLQRRGWSDRRAILTAGIAVGVTALLCPNLLLVPALFVAAEGAWRVAEWKRVLVAGLGIFAITLVVILPWVVRNYYALGGFVPLRSNLGLELAVGNRPGADGHTYCLGFAEMHPFASAAERGRLAERGELAYMRDKGQLALTWIADHPAGFASLTLRRAWLFWFGMHESWWRLECPTRTRVAGVIGLTAILALLGLLCHGRPAGRLLACALLGAAVPYFVTHVEPRYRFPVVGLFALLSCDLVLTTVRRLALMTQAFQPIRGRS